MLDGLHQFGGNIVAAVLFDVFEEAQLVVITVVELGFKTDKPLPCCFVSRFRVGLIEIYALMGGIVEVEHPVVDSMGINQLGFHRIIPHFCAGKWGHVGNRNRGQLVGIGLNKVVGGV